MWLGPKSKDFWPTIKPFLSQKSTHKSDSQIILKNTESNTLISDQHQEAEHLNTFYINIAKNIGIENNVPVNDEHPSINAIHSNIKAETFDFSKVTEKCVSLCI